MDQPFPAILDVTLRDGGHRNNFEFSNQQVAAILTAIDQSQVPYVEVGYRGGSIRPKPDIGIAGLCPDHYLRYCAEYLTYTKLAVMAHPHNICAADIEALKDCDVALLRLCTQIGKLKPALEIAKIAQKNALPVSINLIHISQYEIDSLLSVLEQIVTVKPQYIYFADSNGHLQPERVTHLFNIATQIQEITFGFHSHDNLGLAQTNSIAAWRAGAKMVDASLAGAGKGIGNLRLEYFVAYLISKNCNQYTFSPLVEISNRIRLDLEMNKAVSIGEFLRGLEDLSTKQLAERYHAMETVSC